MHKKRYTDRRDRFITLLGIKMKHIYTFILLAFLIPIATAKGDLFHDLNSILDIHNKVTEKNFSEHINNFKYVPWINEGGFVTYISYNEETDDPSPGPASILFFHNGYLFAILNIGRLNKNHFSETDEVAGYLVGYIDNPQKALIANFKHIYYKIFRYAD